MIRPALLFEMVVACGASLDGIARGVENDDAFFSRVADADPCDRHPGARLQLLNARAVMFAREKKQLIVFTAAEGVAGSRRSG
jgi:hypothetical protein